MVGARGAAQAARAAWGLPGDAGLRPRLRAAASVAAHGRAGLPAEPGRGFATGAVPVGLAVVPALRPRPLPPDDVMGHKTGLLVLE